MFPTSRSQTRDLETGTESGNGHLDRPLSVISSQTPRGGLHFRDSSRLLFTMYSKIAEEKDNRMVERWQNDADGILIFAGLFSAVVATLLSVTIPDLKPSPQPQPQGNSDFYLKNICLALSDQNDSCQPPPSPVVSSPFSPSKPTIWVNSLLFLSLVISLTCAMLATFIQRWARRYIGITQSSRYSPHKRARLREFFSDGIDKWHVSWAVEALPTLLHLSLFLFFVGLVIYLFSINHSVFGSVIWWVVLSMMAYLCITLLPMFRPNSPYYAPLSSLLWFLYTCISCAIFKVLSSGVFRRYGFMHRFHRSRKYHKRFSEKIKKTTAETALLRSSEIDVHVLESILDALGEDAAWEKFFEAIPGFFESDLVEVDKENLPEEFRIKFTQALSGFLDCTFSLSSVTESLRGDRLVICLHAAHAALGPDGVSQILQDILSGRWPELLQSVVMGHSLRRWRNSNDEQFNTNVRRIVTHIVVGVRERDNRWFSLVKAEYGIAEHVIRKYIGRGGDSVLLFILIHMTRQAFHTGTWTPWILSSLSDFNIRDTSPDLQHVFCELWNDIVLEARNEDWSSEEGSDEEGPTNIPVQILRDVRQVYITLHQGTDAALTVSSAFPYHFHPALDQPRSYRLCTVTSHRQSLSINTPVSGSFTIPSVIQPNRSPAASPLHSSPTESDRTPDGSTASQQLEKTDIKVTVEPPSIADDAPDPSDTRRFTFPPLVTNFMRATQATPIACPSVHESITCDPGVFVVPGEASHDSRESMLSTVRSDEPVPLIQISESGESYQAPMTSSLTFQHLDAIPATITPSTEFDPSDGPDALQNAPSPTTLTYFLETDKTIAPCAASDISEISSTANLIPPSIRTGSSTVVSDCPPSPIPPSVHSSSMTAGEPAPIQPDQFLDALRSLSSSLTTASSHISPQAASPFDVQITLRIGTPTLYDETHGLNPPIPMTVLLHLAKTAPPAHDIVVPTLQPEGQVQHGPDKL